MLNLKRRDGSFSLIERTISILRIYLDEIERSAIVPVALAFFFVTAQAHAGEIEPRSYVNTPVGINFLLAGYSYSDGGLSTTAREPEQLDQAFRKHRNTHLLVHP